MHRMTTDEIIENTRIGLINDTFRMIRPGFFQCEVGDMVLSISNVSGCVFDKFAYRISELLEIIKCVVTVSTTPTTEIQGIVLD